MITYTFRALLSRKKERCSHYILHEKSQHSLRIGIQHTQAQHPSLYITRVMMMITHITHIKDRVEHHHRKKVYHKTLNIFKYRFFSCTNQHFFLVRYNFSVWLASLSLSNSIIHYVMLCTCRSSEKIWPEKCHSARHVLHRNDCLAPTLKQREEEKEANQDHPTV